MAAGFPNRIPPRPPERCPLTQPPWVPALGARSVLRREPLGALCSCTAHPTRPHPMCPPECDCHTHGPGSARSPWCPSTRESGTRGLMSGRVRARVFGWGVSRREALRPHRHPPSAPASTPGSHAAGTMWVPWELVKAVPGSPQHCGLGPGTCTHNQAFWRLLSGPQVGAPPSQPREGSPTEQGC